MESIPAWKKWDLAHPEKRKAANEKYHKSDKRKLWRKRNAPKLRMLSNKSWAKNKDAANARRRAKLKILRATPEWKKQWAKYVRDRRAASPELRIINNTRSRMREILKQHKSKKSLELVGCSPKELREHLESKFTEGMSWENYGPTGWHIDHIIPCAAFDLIDPKQQKECFHYTNLQPLWAGDNIRKKDKIV